VVFVLVVALGIEVLADRPKRWTAETSLVILPSREVDRWAAANAEEALSSGDAASTIAAVLSSPKIVNPAVDGAGPSARPQDRDAVTVTVVPATVVLRVASSAGTPDTAESIAGGIVSEGSTYLRTISSPYRLVVVRGAAGTARTQQPVAPVAFLLIGALAAGLAAQQAWYRLAVAGRRRARRRTVPSVGTTAMPAARPADRTGAGGQPAPLTDAYAGAVPAVQGDPT
jgi:capsular polysaccharide biosynthesis protein